MVSKTKRLIFVSALALSIMGGSLYSARVAKADDSTFHTELVEKIAQKFNLKKEDVQAVFESSRVQRRAQMQAAYEARLASLVASGEITASQRDSLLAKHKELEQTRKTNREQLENWAKSNNIDSRLLFGGKKMGRFHLQ